MFPARPSDEPIAMVTPNGNGTYSRKYFHTAVHAPVMYGRPLRAGGRIPILRPDQIRISGLGGASAKSRTR